MAITRSCMAWLRALFTRCSCMLQFALGAAAAVDTELTEENVPWNRVNSSLSRLQDPARAAWYMREIPSWNGQSASRLRQKVSVQFDAWFVSRGISNQWTREPALDLEIYSAIYYKFDNGPPTTTERMSSLPRSFANAFFQDVWWVSDSGGCLKASRRFLGVYIMPIFEAAMGRAWATSVFNDGIFHACIWDIASDRVPEEGRQDLIRMPAFLMLRGLWIVVDKHVNKNDPRFYYWDHQLETLPPGRTRPTTAVDGPMRLLSCRAPRDWVES